MVNASISLAEVVGMVIRLTRSQDTSMIPDLHEWAAMGMQLLGTTPELVPVCARTTISFHRLKRPCGMIVMDTIGWNGCKIRQGRGRTVHGPVSHDAIFVTGITKENTPTGNFMYGSYANKVDNMPWHSEHWFEEERTFVTTSLPDGVVDVYGQQVPCDEEGFPLVPDEGSYKMALYYFCRACMVGAGFKDTVFTYEQLMQHFEVECGRAKEAITYPSVNRMDEKVYNWLNMIPPNTDRYSQYFVHA